MQEYKNRVVKLCLGSKVYYTIDFTWATLVKNNKYTMFPIVSEERAVVARTWTTVTNDQLPC